MSDMDDEVRRTLQQRADDVRPHREVPPGLGRRAGRRIALNSVMVGAVAVVLATGAVVGVRAIGGPDERRPGGGHTSAPPEHTQGTGAGATHACTAGRLRAVGTFEGAAGSREGAIVFTNFSDTTCTLRGTPTISLLRSPGHPAAGSMVFLPSPPGWKANGDSRPPGWPKVSLRPGAAASVRIRWGNWCPQGRTAPLWEVAIPGGGRDGVNGFDSDPPPCNGDGPSTIEVGPFEPARQ